MTIAIPEPSGVVVQQQQDMQTQAVARLADWAHSAQAAHQVAQSLVQTSFVPEAFRGKPHEATAAILAGAEVGLSPMASLRSFDVIQGTAAPRAITLRAIVQSQGHEMILVESTATRCRMKGRRRGSSEWVEVVWTLDRAKDLGLTNKPNWKNQSGTMLVARASSELARLIAADAILGIGYTVEELNDGAVPTQPPSPALEPTNGAASGTRRMSRKRAEPAPEPEPADDQPLPADEPDKQMRMMFALLNEAGYREKQESLDYIETVIGRKIESRSELTTQEKSQIIDALQSDTDA